jgi:hypothetical protein
MLAEWHWSCELWCASCGHIITGQDNLMLIKHDGVSVFWLGSERV